MTRYILLASLLLIGACQSKKSDELVVGFSQLGPDGDWRNAETKSIRGTVEKRGIKLKFADAQKQQGQQIMHIRSFIDQRVKAIILAPLVETGWTPVLTEAKKAGIPVILVDRGINVKDESLYVTKIASDFIEEGQRAAEWMARKMNGKAKIVELEGQTGASATIERKKGFAEALKKHPDMTIIKSQCADFEQNKGRAVMEALLKSDREAIQAVYAHNDDMALGAIQAIEAAGLKPGKDIVIVSVDGTPAALKAIAEGKLNASVECSPFMGPMAFDVIAKVLAGQSVPKYLKNEDLLFDESNVAQYVGKREY